MTRRDTLARDSQFSSLGLRYTRFRISLIKVLKPQNAMTCGYLCKSVHLTALPVPKTFFSCLAVFHLILANLYFLCICLFFTSNWPLATTSRGTLRKLNWSVQGEYPKFCELFWAMAQLNQIFEMVHLKWTNLLPKLFSIAVILFSFLPQCNVVITFVKIGIQKGN